jgi:perosamine synthetase
MNANAARNGQYLSEGLSSIQGVEPPYVPSDRTTNYHKYRVRLFPERLGLEIEATDFRDKILAALKAEGVSVALWQLFPLPANPLFQHKVGFGKGYPFQFVPEVDYDSNQYSETWKLCDGSLVVCSEEYPIYPQKLELMKHYVAAFEKVFADIDEVLKIETEKKPEMTAGRAELV